jgi:hypothetical protein
MYRYTNIQITQIHRYTDSQIYSCGPGRDGPGPAAPTHTDLEFGIPIHIESNQHIVTSPPTWSWHTFEKYIFSIRIELRINHMNTSIHQYIDTSIHRYIDTLTRTCTSTRTRPLDSDESNGTIHWFDVMIFMLFLVSLENLSYLWTINSTGQTARNKTRTR